MVIPFAPTASAVTDFVVRFVGESGEGTVTLGDSAVRRFTALGLDVCTFQTFPAEIKGGTVMYQIRAATSRPLSHGDHVDIMVALNHDGFRQFNTGIDEHTIVLFNSDAFRPEPMPGRLEIALPITSLAHAQKEAVRHEVSAEILKRLPAPVNTVGLGALLRLLGAPLQPAEDDLRRTFTRKGAAVVQMNVAALHAGADAVPDSAVARIGSITPQPRTSPVMTVNGNQMIALGALAGGVQFFSGYPITPSTEIMETLARELPQFGGRLVQAEDEMAALGMCLGASFGGAKSMTATSGPGLSLMVEQVNLAGQAEIPVVLVDVQRGGASTGMPTKTSQGDLHLASVGVHNESPRIVLAAAGIEDCFWIMVEAFNLAEAYQCPVIVLSDQSLATRKATIRPPDLSRVAVRNRVMPDADALRSGYARYEDTSTGVSPMSTPGMVGGAYVATGIEHDEGGHPGYSRDLANQMKLKRFRKMETLAASRGADFVNTWGDEGQVDVGVISFGSTEDVLREAIDRARATGCRVAHLHLRMLLPMPVDVVHAFAERCRELLVPELDFSGQLAGMLRSTTGVRPQTYHRDDGEPFTPREICEQVTRLALAGCPKEAGR